MKRKMAIFFLTLCLCAAFAFVMVGCEEGQAGKDGATWLSGTDAPTSAAGSVGDFYLDEDDFDIYKNTEDGWVLIGNIKGEAGPQGPAGVDGEDGQDGAQGPAGSDGQDGAQGEQGPAGEDGQDGTDGQDGKTPYIGENGNWWIGDTDTGVKAEGVDGEDGADGAQGEQGPAGEDGADGKTPYIGENGNWWIGDTDTGVKAEGVDGADGQDGAQGPQGEKGEQGEQGPQGEKGEQGDPGVGIEDVAVSYGYNDAGREVIIFTFYYSDGSEKTVEVELPRKFVNAWVSDYSEMYEIIPEGEETPVWRMQVQYEDGSEELVVTEDMFVVDDTYGLIDFHTAGRYPVKIVYNGYTVYTGTVTVYDPNDDSIASIETNAERVVALVDEGGALIENYAGLEIMVYRANGNGEPVMADDPRVQIDTSAFSGAGTIFEVEVTYTEGEQSASTSFEVVPLTNEQLGDTNVMKFYMGEMYYVESSYSVEAGQDPFNGYEGALLTGTYLPADKTAAYYFPITSDMLVDGAGNPFDYNTVSAETDYYLDMQYTFGVMMNPIRITVYDPNDTSVSEVTLNEQSAVALVDEGGSVLQPLFGLELTVHRANGETEEIAFTAEDPRVSFDMPETLMPGNPVDVTVTFTENGQPYTTSFTAVPLTEEMLRGDEVKFHSAELVSELGEYACEVGGTPFTNGEYIVLRGYYPAGDYDVAHMLPAAADMLINQETQEPFSSEAESEGWYIFDSEKLYGFDIGYSIKVTVCDPADVTVGEINVVGTMGFAVGEGSFDDWQIRVTYYMGTGGSFIKMIAFDESMIAPGSVDFGSPGYYVVPVTYAEEGRGEASELVNVQVRADLSAEEVTATYYFTENTAMLLGVDSVTLYANGVLTLGDYQYAYTLQDGLLSYKYGTDMTFTLREDEASGLTYLEAYIPEGECDMTYVSDAIRLRVDKYEAEGYLVLYRIGEGENFPVMATTVSQNADGYYLLMGAYYELVDPVDGEANGTINQR